MHAVHVWWAEHALADPSWLRLLDAGERERYEAYHRPADAARFLTGATLVRRLFARHLGVRAAEVRLLRTCPDCPRPHGRVRLDRRFHAGAAPLEVSVSHSGRWVVVAACRTRPVGVDVERVDAALDHAGLARFALPPAEQEALRSLSGAARASAFTQMWSRREAAVKATGEGLRAPVDELDLTPAGPAWIGTWPKRPARPPVQVYDLRADAEHRASVALLGAGPATVSAHTPAGLRQELVSTAHLSVF